MRGKWMEVGDLIGLLELCDPQTLVMIQGYAGGFERLPMEQVLTRTIQLRERDGNMRLPIGIENCLVILQAEMGGEEGLHFETIGCGA